MIICGIVVPYVHSLPISPIKSLKFANFSPNDKIRFLSADVITCRLQSRHASPTSLVYVVLVNHGRLRLCSPWV